MNMEQPISVKEAAEEARVHPETIADALRSGALHGSQRVKGGTWRIRPSCLEAWAYGLACEHRQAIAA